VGDARGCLRLSAARCAPAPHRVLIMRDKACLRSRAVCWARVAEGVHTLACSRTGWCASRTDPGSPVSIAVMSARSPLFCQRRADCARRCAARSSTATASTRLRCLLRWYPGRRHATTLTTCLLALLLGARALHVRLAAWASVAHRVAVPPPLVVGDVELVALTALRTRTTGPSAGRLGSIAPHVRGAVTFA